MAATIGEPFVLSSYGISKSTTKYASELSHSSTHIWSTNGKPSKNSDGQATITVQGNGVHVIDVSFMYNVKFGMSLLIWKLDSYITSSNLANTRAIHLFFLPIHFPNYLRKSNKNIRSDRSCIGFRCIGEWADDLALDARWRIKEETLNCGMSTPIWSLTQTKFDRQELRYRMR